MLFLFSPPTVVGEQLKGTLSSGTHLTLFKVLLQSPQVQCVLQSASRPNGHIVLEPSVVWGSVSFKSFCRISQATRNTRQVHVFRCEGKETDA